MSTRNTPLAALAIAWLATTVAAQTEPAQADAVVPNPAEEARPVEDVQEPSRADMQRLLRAHRERLEQARTEVRMDRAAIRETKGGDARHERRARLRRRLAALVRNQDRRGEARRELRDQRRRDEARRELRDQGRRDEARRDLRDQGRRKDARLQLRDRGRAGDARRRDRRAHPGARRRDGAFRRTRARREPGTQSPPRRGRLHDV